MMWLAKGRGRKMDEVCKSSCPPSCPKQYLHPDLPAHPVLSICPPSCPPPRPQHLSTFLPTPSPASVRLPAHPVLSTCPRQKILQMSSPRDYCSARVDLWHGKTHTPSIVFVTCCTALLARSPKTCCNTQVFGRRPRLAATQCMAAALHHAT